MKLGEKIAILRKERNWSQEELAMQLDISRQSVSKWESENSVPDLDKVVRLSEIFGVSLDFLLKEDIEELPASPERAPEAEWQDRGPEPRLLPEEEAEEYMEFTERSAKKMAAAVSACIFSPVFLLLLIGLAGIGRTRITEDMAGGIGCAVLLLIIGVAVAIFIINGMTSERYEYLEREDIRLPQNCREAVERKCREFEGTHKGCIAAGVVICILSVLPLLIAAAFGAGDGAYILCVAVLLVVVAAGVYPIVWSSLIWGCYEKLLQVGDYTSEKKSQNRFAERISKVYWSVVTAIYLAVSFGGMGWDRSWIIWPVAGVLFAAVSGIFGRPTRGN